MNAALSAQKARTLTEVGVGSTRLVGGVAPPPQSPYWRAVAQPAGFWASAALNPSFRSAYNASAETRVMGTMRPILWRCWRANGIWYATSRGSASAVPTLFQYLPADQASIGRGLKGIPSGLSGPITRLLDDDGFFDPHKCGMGSTATTDVDLQRWAQLPVQPDAASPLWRTMTSTELALQDKILGWDSAVATAQTHGQRMFKFKGSWYRADRNGFSVLTGGSGRSGHRGLQGVAAAGGGSHVKYGPTSGVSGVYGVGQTNSSFVPPTATERANLPPGDPLVNATQAMLTTFAANGVPSEHADSPVVRAFQVAFNADPLSNLHGSNGKLSVDGGYGPNSHDAAAVIAGSAVPDVNTAPAPVATVTPTLPTAPSSSSTSTTTSSSSSTSSYTKPLIIGALVLGAGVVTAAVLTHKKKGGKRKYRVVAPMRQLRE